MIGTSGLLHIDTGNESATGIDTFFSNHKTNDSFGARERASGGYSGTFKIEDMLSGYHQDPRGAKSGISNQHDSIKGFGYTDRRDRAAGGSGRYLIKGYQGGRDSAEYQRAIGTPAMNTELINVQGHRKDPLGIRKMLKRNKVSGKIANVVDGIRGMFKGRKLLRRTKL
tara:strand:- start:1369 stop:1875 length:507 start_codon:yes stop_codon:yes gene_type:complete